MKIAVRYQSRGGNTKAIAEAIAKAAGVTAQPIDAALEEPVDLLFVGGGVYAFSLDRALRAFLKKLDAGSAKCIAAFSTAGSSNGAKKIAAIAKARGISVREEMLPVQMRERNNAFVGKKGDGALTAQELEAVEAFVKSACK